MIGDIKAALDIVNGIKNLLSSWSKSPSDSAQGQEISAQLSELQSFIGASEKEKRALIAHTRKLEAEITQLKDWTKEKERYQFRQMRGVISGTFPVYSLKDEYVEPGEKPHHLCAACFEDGKKAILSFFDDAASNSLGLTSHCPVHGRGLVPIYSHHV